MLSPWKTIVVTTSMVCAVGVTPSLAQTRFATVDMARVLREWVEVKKIAAWLQKQKEEYQEVIDQKQTRIKRINEELQDTTTPAPKKQNLEREKGQALRELQDEFQKLKVRLAELEKNEFDRIKAMIYIEIDNIVRARKLEMVFEKQWLYFPRDGADITDELLSMLDRAIQQRRPPPPPRGGGRPQPPGR